MHRVAAVLSSMCIVAISVGPLHAESARFPQSAKSCDVVVYGATAGGAIAAVQSSRSGKTVILVEPSVHVGGMTSGGLGATDIGNKGAIGGLSRDFYRRLGSHYAKSDSWRYERFEDFPARRQGEAEMWLFEPHAAESVLRDMLAEAKVEVLSGQRLDLQNGVEMRNGRIESISMESGLRLRGRVFIDATYEGDLMAKSGVSYHVGREANSTYGETLNGFQTKNAVYHQFVKPVDPYVKPGDRTSSLLPGISAEGPPRDGDGDRRIQAYCFRMCTTDVRENQVEWQKPADYDPLRYELLLRNFEAGDTRVPWNPIRVPNRKTDVNNNYAVSTDNIGMNYDYPDGDYATRERIVREHLSYQQGLMWTLANNSRVPADVRKHFQNWKPAKDEFADTSGWPHQLYIREARRLVSDYVMTQHDCQGRRTAEDSVGLAAYTMDSHHIQRIVKDGHVYNEGDVQVGGFAPYPVSYRAICPKKSQCTNLLVPVCLSASHIAYDSIRMEPVFMVLGQSAATAACLAIDENIDVQDVDYRVLSQKLLEQQQILSWTGPRPTPTLLSSELDGIVVDDVDATFVGNWMHAKSLGGFVDAGYLHDRQDKSSEMKAIFRPTIANDGLYEVRISCPAVDNRAEHVGVIVAGRDGETAFTINQKAASKTGKPISLGRVHFAKGDSGSVTISNAGTTGFVVVDAVQFVPVAE